MSPFIVECTTCRRKLLVRSDALVGQILTCPKCGSMVLIEPPAAEGSPGQQSGAVPRANVSTAASQSSTRLMEGEVNKLLVAEDPQQADTVPDPTLDPNYVPPAPSLISLPVTQQLGGEDWVKAESQQIRKWLTIGAIATAAAVTLIVVFGLAMSRRPPARSKQQASTQVAPASPQSSSRKGAPSSNAENENNATNSSTSSGTPPAETIVDKTASQPSSPSTTPLTPADTVLPIEPAPPSSPSDAASTANVPPSADANPAPAPNNDATTSAPAAAPNVGDPGNLRAAVHTLNKLEELIDDTTMEPAQVIEDSPYDLLPTPGIPFDLGEALPKPAPREINTTAQLAIKLPEIEFRDARLIDVLQFVSDFTMIPITLDTEALFRSGLTPSTKVELHATNQEISKILQDVLTPLGLRYVVSNGHLLVRQVNDDRLVQRKYEVFDLVGADPNEGNALLSVVEALVAPTSWESRGGPGSLTLEEAHLVVNNTARVHFEILVFCQHLRLARGLKPQGELPQQAAALELRFAKALPKLGQPVTASFPLPTPLAKILRHLASTSGMDLVVDWQALAEAGWTTDALARLEVTEQPLSKALQKLLGPMELSFRVIDATTLEITSGDVAFHKSEIGFFPIGDVLDEAGAQKLLEAVRTSLGDSILTEKGGTGVRFDNTSRALVVAAPQYQLAAVAKLIARMRK